MPVVGDGRCFWILMHVAAYLGSLGCGYALDSGPWQCRIRDRDGDVNALRIFLVFRGKGLIEVDAMACGHFSGLLEGVFCVFFLPQGDISMLSAYEMI